MRMRTNGVMDKSSAGRSVRIVNKIKTLHGKESLRVLKPGMGMEGICGAGLGSGAAAAAGTSISVAARKNRASAGIAARIVVESLIFNRICSIRFGFRLRCPVCFLNALVQTLEE